MKKLKLLSLLLIISLFVCALPVQALALDAPVIAADSAIVMDTATGDILFQKNSSRTVSPGTLATLMTALVAGDALDTNAIALDDTVTASDNFLYNIPEGANVAGIMAGEQLTVGDLLNCIVLASAADACNILAEHISGSVGTFVEAMNAKAAELGCSSTYFVNANGVDVAGQQTTARDMALIAQALTKNSTILDIFGVASYNMPATNLADTRTIYTTNALLDPNSEFHYDNAYGFRNAALSDAGFATVAGATNGDMDVIAVVIGCPDLTNSYWDAQTAFLWLFANFSYRQILSDTESLTTIPVEMGNPDSVGVRGEDQIRIILPNDQELGDVRYEVTYQHELQNTTLQAPVSVGQYLGDVVVYVDGVQRGSSRLVASTSVDISRTEYLNSQLETLLQNNSVRQLIKILIIILGIYLLLVIFYFIQRILHLHSLRRARKARAKAQARQEVEWLDIPEGGQEDAAPTAYFQEPPAQAENYAPAPAQEPYDEPVGQHEAYYPPEDSAPEEGPYDDGQYPPEEGPYDDGQYPPEEPPAQDGGEADYGPEDDGYYDQ